MDGSVIKTTIKNVLNNMKDILILLVAIYIGILSFTWFNKQTNITMQNACSQYGIIKVVHCK